MASSSSEIVYCCKMRVVSSVLGLGFASAFLSPPAPRTRARVVGVRPRAAPLMGITVDFMDYTIGNQEPPARCPVTPTRPDQSPEMFEITDEQRETLLRDGVVHIKGVLTPEWLEYLRTVSDW